MQLKDKSLLETAGWIGGNAYRGEEKTFAVIDPATQKELAHVADLSSDDAKKAIEAAHSSFATWSRLAPLKRENFLQKWADLIEENQNDLAMILSCEQGKPLSEANSEVLSSVRYLRWYAEEARRIYGRTLLSPTPEQRLMTIFQPMGVVAAISPWNFPLSISLKKCAPALAAGCTVVLKPPEDTPLSALAIVSLAHRVADFPPGILNVIPCSDPKEVGQVLTTHPLVRKVTFTGSTDVGKLIAKNCSETLKRMTLELGGNCPAIVCADADLEKAAADLIDLKRFNCGQCCISVNRLYVEASVIDAFLPLLKENIEKHILIGRGREENVTMGPLINQDAFEKVSSLVNDALEKGANCPVGQNGENTNPPFYKPTILLGMTEEMNIFQQEVFGPVLPIYPFSSIDEVLDSANRTHYGLAAYVYTKDWQKGWEVAERLEAGNVAINGWRMGSEYTPFGGWKESGIGREAGIGSLVDYCENKSLSFSRT